MRFDPGSIGLGRGACARGRVLDAALGGVRARTAARRRARRRRPRAAGSRRATRGGFARWLRRAQLRVTPTSRRAASRSPPRRRLALCSSSDSDPLDELRHHLGFEVPLEVSHGVSSVGGPLELLRGGGGGLLGGGGVRLRHPRASRRGVRARRLRLGESPRRLRLRLGGDGVPVAASERRLEALRALPRELMALLRARVRDDAAPRGALLRGHRGGARSSHAAVRASSAASAAAARRSAAALPRRRAPRLRRRATDLALSLEDELTKTVNHRGGPPRPRPPSRASPPRAPRGSARRVATARRRPPPPPPRANARAPPPTFSFPAEDDPPARRRADSTTSANPLDARALRPPRPAPPRGGGPRRRSRSRRAASEDRSFASVSPRASSTRIRIRRRAGPPEDHGGAPGVCGDGVDAFLAAALSAAICSRWRACCASSAFRVDCSRASAARLASAAASHLRASVARSSSRAAVSARASAASARWRSSPRAQFAQPRLRARRRPERRGEVRFRPRRAVSARGGLRGELRAPPLQRRLGGLRRRRLGGERDDVLFAIARPASARSATVSARTRSCAARSSSKVFARLASRFAASASASASLCFALGALSASSASRLASSLAASRLAHSARASLASSA